MKQALLLLPLAATLAACAPSSVTGLRDAPAGRESVVVEQHYEDVYRTVADRARDCFQLNFLVQQMVVYADLFPSKRLGTVTIQQRGMLGDVNTWLTIDITSLGDKSSRVEVLYGSRLYAPVARTVLTWPAGGKDCRA
jgi:hypothetical protein